VKAFVDYVTGGWGGWSEPVTLECSTEEAIVLKALLGGVVVDADVPNRWSQTVVTARQTIGDALNRLGVEHDDLRFETFFRINDGSLAAL
jgi:hypothetical protein